MVDVSHSAAVGVIKRDKTLLTDVGTAVASALEAGDSVRLGTFGDAITLEPVPLHDVAGVSAAALTLAEHMGGASPIWDALAASATAVGPGPARRGIVLVTDGRSTGNRLGFAEVLERLQAARIPVFVVSFDKGDRPIPDPGARLLTLAAKTGGDCLFVERKVMPGAITRAMKALRALPTSTAR